MNDAHGGLSGEEHGGHKSQTQNGLRESGSEWSLWLGSEAT